MFSLELLLERRHWICAHELATLPHIVCLRSSYYNYDHVNKMDMTDNYNETGIRLAIRIEDYRLLENRNNEGW